MKVAALVAFRNAEKWLPSFFDSIQKHVDYVIGLDDCSTDLSGRLFTERSPFLLRRYEFHAPHEFESENRLRLLQLAKAMHVDYALCLDDDERCGLEFRKSLRTHCLRGSIITAPFRNVWTEGFYRTDGVWSAKRKAILFPVRSIEPYYGHGELHCSWVPPLLEKECEVRHLDTPVYHLGSMSPDLRTARVLKFKSIDPDCRCQPLGYDYLADETGMVLAPVDDPYI